MKPILSSSERQEQIVVVKYLRLKYPGVLFFAIPNGGSRNPIEGANLKKEGVTAGVPDLFIARHKQYSTSFLNSKDMGFFWSTLGGLFIEMKSAKGKLSSSQDSVIKKLKEADYQVSVCYSANEAINVIDEYLT